MSSKLKTYVLLILVVGIWGVIAYRVFSAINPSQPSNLGNDRMMAFKPSTLKIKDTFSIQIAERDPFLDKYNVSTKKIKTKSVKRKIIEWLPITFHGTIAKASSTKQIFIITLDGTQHLMKIGQTMKNVKLLKGDTNAITMVYKGTQKTFLKI